MHRNYAMKALHSPPDSKRKGYSKRGNVAFIAIVAVLISIWRQMAESKRYRLSQNVELLLRLEDRFNSATFKREREIAARCALNRNLSGLDPVLDYFETLGLLLERCALDEEMIWSSFSSLYFGYMQIAEKYVTQTRNEDPTLWSYLIKLNNRMNAVHEKLAHKEYPRMSEDEQKVFLRSESSLATDQSVYDLTKII